MITIVMRVSAGYCVPRLLSACLFFFPLHCNITYYAIVLEF